MVNVTMICYTPLSVTGSVTCYTSVTVSPLVQLVLVLYVELNYSSNKLTIAVRPIFKPGCCWECLWGVTIHEWQFNQKGKED